MKYASIDALFTPDDDEGSAPFDRLGKNIKDKIQKVAGFRGLFDMHSSEYQRTPHDQKWPCIEILKGVFDCRLDGLVYLTVKDWNTKWKCYRIDAITYAIYEYAKHHREAEDYLLRCKHPIFLYFAKINAQEDWKSAVDLSIAQKGECVFPKKSLKQLLLVPPFQDEQRETPTK